VKIKGIPTIEYDVYRVSKIKRQTYRKARELLLKVGIRLVVDFHDYEPTLNRT